MRALITGITGQDGSHLADLLLSKGYEVHGMIRRSSSFNTARIDHIFDRLVLHYGDLTDSCDIERVLRLAKPTEVYNLGAQSHVKVSFDTPIYTGDATGLGSARLYEGVRQVCPEARVYQASSSEMFGKVLETPQRETTPFNPRSPYACAKVYAYDLGRTYRDGYGLFISNGILFNHEGPRRGETFVTRKITRAVGRIACGLQKVLKLGNLDAKRDWGYAGDFVEAMWLMLQHSRPDDFVVATGETHSVREFAELAFAHVGLKARNYIEVDPRQFRPAEVDLLLGDPAKAKKELGWEPKVSFGQLVKMMVQHDLNLAEREAHGLLAQ